MKLAKLPDRTPIKITFSASAKLNQDLHGYAALYRDAYGEAASVPQLIPSMLESFLKSDPAFAKVKKAGTLGAGIEKESSAGKTGRARNVHTGSSPASSSNFQITTQTKGI